jgi:5-methylcytosine-specific restriction enzyme A
MPTLPPTFNPRPVSQQAHARQIDRERGSARERGYDAWWDRARRVHLAEHRLCRYCELDGIVTAATVVDHFWGRGPANAWFRIKAWWVSSCAPCHNGFKQATERQGRVALAALALRLGLTAPR